MHSGVVCFSRTNPMALLLQTPGELHSQQRILNAAKSYGARCSVTVQAEDIAFMHFSGYGSRERCGRDHVLHV